MAPIGTDPQRVVGPKTLNTGPREATARCIGPEYVGETNGTADERVELRPGVGKSRLARQVRRHPAQPGDLIT